MIKVRCKRCRAVLGEISEDSKGRLELMCRKQQCRHPHTGVRYVNRVKMEEVVAKALRADTQNSVAVPI